ncbi:MAG: DUF1080 domain-containing protein, partial [Planctomycetes bacterium]|nr:DUF1080 domain-containing protein [Planctomycetota bacterium]
MIVRRLALVSTLIVSLPFCALAQPADSTPANTLSAAEKAAGWKLLFDGKSTSAWRGYKQQKFPEKGWAIDGDSMKVSKGGGDIITLDEFGEFEFSFEFKLSEKANSGVMYRVAEKHDTAWQTGPEFQLLDDAGNGASPTDAHSTGACYDLYPPAAGKKMNPAGQFNAASIRLKAGVLQHFVNGVKVVECRVDGEEWKQKIAASKFKGYEGFGVLPKGHIAIQDHGNDVWFRNMKIRDLSAPMPREKTLFDGKSMAGWTYFLDNKGKMEDVWSVQDGIIICKGNPVGYIRTEADYTNYVLKLEWRFNPVTKKPGNSGVLQRLQMPDKVWPKSVEAQLQHENAGDFWNIDEFQMKTVAERLNGRNTKKTHFAERPLGEWNEYEIIVDHAKITLNVNGETLNEAWDVGELAGKVALQSEGAA